MSVRPRSTATGPALDDVLLSVRDLEVSYGQTQVLFGVDLDVRRGEVLALLGTNGAGKSTVLKAISGLATPARGVIRLGEHDLTEAGPAETLDHGVVHVPGGRGVFPELSVLDNLRAAGWRQRGDRATRDERITEVFGRFPALAQRAATLAGDLSGGEQQMVSLGQAFLADPELLLIDELSLGLAPAIVDHLIGIVREINAAGTTVVIVEQSVRTALRLAERAVFLEKGEVRFSGATAELAERSDIVRAVYLRGAAAAEAGPSAPASVPAAPTRRRVLAAPPAPVLEAEGLTRRYGGVTAVDDLSFALHHGEVLGLVGPNGAGKTTVFDLLSGFSRPDAGRVRFHGSDVTGRPAHARAIAGLGRSFQDARLWTSMTVREALSLAVQPPPTLRAALVSLLGMGAARRTEVEVRGRVDDLVELFGLGAFRDKLVGDLSTGSRRVVELACLVAGGPSVVLLDEPSSGIAQREAEGLGELIRRVRADLGASVLIIEHDMPLLTSVADRLVALDVGRFVTSGTVDEVLSHPHVVASYLGEREEASA